ncbi:hypothetical protein KP509_25G042200 [Ceratopteris richardii]|nr:hypothetical protein KP509_25G042200 [Ceratopteris richardii]
MHKRWKGGSLLLLLLFCVCNANAWPTWRAKNQNSAAPAGSDSWNPAKSSIGTAFEFGKGHAVVEEEGISKTLLLKQARLTAKSSSDGLCYQSAYNKLLSSCSQILQNDEKKSRLAFEFTECFLKMTGGPPLPRCPDTSLVRFCTEKFDDHTKRIYLAFFIETAAMCYHIQSDVFKKETEDVVNDLKETSHEVVKRVKEVEGLSHQIINDALKQSEKLQEKLSGVEALSQSLLTQKEHFERQLKSQLDTAQEVYESYGRIRSQQGELQVFYDDMHKTINNHMKELQNAVLDANEQIHSTSEGYKHLAQEQTLFANSFLKKIEHLKESFHVSFDDLKESHILAAQEARLSLQELVNGVQKAQNIFHSLQTKVDVAFDLHLKNAHAILEAQVALSTKQSSILSSLDRIFSLFDSSLYDLRALKTLTFYALSLFLLSIFTNAKQLQSTKVYLYAGLCISIAMEMYVTKTYGSLPRGQEWIQTVSYFIRMSFGVSTLIIILYRIFTYRDLSCQSHELLLQLHQRFCELANHYDKSTLYPDASEDKCCSGQLQFAPTSKSVKQFLASNILRRTLKLARGERESHQNADSSLEDDDDPDYQFPETDIGKVIYRSSYNLRSFCNRR